MALKTLVVGRSAFADIVIADESVASHHVELVVTDDGRLYLTDCGTETGTWRQRAPAASGTPDAAQRSPWKPMRQGFVRPEEPLRLGEYLCTAGDLVGRSRVADGYEGGGSSAGDDGQDNQARRLRGRVERDAATGEIVRRRP